MTEEEIIRICRVLGDDSKFNELRTVTGAQAGVINALADVHYRLMELRKEADTDYLTGVWNRRYFFRRVDDILDAARENNNEEFRAAVLIYDLDDFKMYNDTYGHAVGDEILKDTAKLITSMCRQHDVVARVGGDEFAVLLWDHKPRRSDSVRLRDAYELADRFRKAIATFNPPSLGKNSQGHLTISGGLAIWPENGDDCDKLLMAADMALIKAKKEGKDRIKIVGE